MAQSYEELRSLTDEELVEWYDASSANVSLGLGFIRDEIHRREMAKAQHQMEQLTSSILLLTVALAILTVTNLVILIFIR